MPRIGFTPEELSTGGSNFDFAEGRGRVIACTAYNHEIPGYPPAACGYKASIQRLDANWKPTSDEPQDEFISWGAAGEVTYPSGGTAVAKFHPARAKSEDDDFGGEEPWGSKADLGEEDGAEGNTVIVNPDWGKGPDKKSKIGIFGSSLVEHGVKKSLLNGWAANLVGLEAHFTRFMMEKPRNSTSKNDPTCLIIGKGGQVKGIETKDAVHKYPDAQTGSKPAASAARVTPPGPKAVPSKANGAPPVETVAEPEEAAGAGAVGGEVEDITLKALQDMQEGSKGQTLTRTRLKTRVTTKLAQAKVDARLHKAAGALIEGEWFVGAAEDLGWQMSPDKSAVTIPA